ncbi:uncharacterized protein F4807DRAFT_453294 [Annulohypoxylon truncatum]|uniref:uncharacterized protein n=1 Tax=Annulohypoxylon truncatum TaxID=327061 RepID=UPI00200866D6|nr:uncharacterized protein F4807DRAFT_453294 [Annulohypoxylon truncatum]KAI1206766.1 hypothetical protein F4807DRAFT_453294 [Annulohypoxylon truncatum]
MGTRGWDILWTNFSDIVDWWNLESFAIQFGDLVAVKTLSMMRRYGPSESSDKNVPTWYVPDEDISQECTLAMMQGFVAVTKGLCESIGPSTSTEYGITKERQARSYLVGRMDKNDEFAQQLIRELSERVAGLQVLVYDREKRDVPGRLVSPLLADQNPWITRSRSASKREVLGSQLWVVEWSIGNVLDDIESINSLTGNDMTKDYYEFIIIDRAPGRQFDLLDVVADALLKLRGDPPYVQVFRQATQKYIPAEEQAAYFEDVANVQTNELTPGFPQYVGNRIRCWDIPNTVRDILRTLLQDKCRTITKYESRIISRVSADLESHGIITKILEYEPPDVSPVIMPGIDGLDDVYFPYDLGLIKEQAEIGCIVGFDPLKNNLFEFSAAYKRAHPNALFAKGRVNMPYCAWPSPVPAGLGFSHINFSTPEGRMYRWEKLPFDMPMSPYVWQVFAHLRIHTQLSFVRIVQSTFVICADSGDSALANLRALLAIGEKHGLTFSVPPPSLWTNDIRSLGLESLWEGTRLFLQT